MKALFSLVSGLDLNDEFAQLRLSVANEHLLIEERAQKGFRTITEATYSIPLSNIIAVEEVTEKELTEKNKSAIGRGVAGGLIFGPAGLVLGGLSGVGKKEAIKKTLLFVISYVSSDGEIANVALIKYKTSNHLVTTKFQKYVQKELKKITPSPEVLKYRTQDNSANTKNIIL